MNIRYCVWFISVSLFLVTACNMCQPKDQSEAAKAIFKRNDIKAATQSGELKVIDDIVGQGEEAIDGKKVFVHYTGWLVSGVRFDSSKDNNHEFSFVLGRGRVIQGWDKGVKGMKVGGKRVIVIPPAMAYGDKGAGDNIPPHATLIFEIELNRIENEPENDG